MRWDESNKSNKLTEAEESADKAEEAILMAGLRGIQPFRYTDILIGLRRLYLASSTSTNTGSLLPALLSTVTSRYVHDILFCIKNQRTFERIMRYWRRATRPK